MKQQQQTMTEKKVYVLDTNVLLSDSGSLFKFKENDVVIPLIVLEELDRHKDRGDQVGKNAREVARQLGALVKEHKDLSKGVPINEFGGLLFIAYSTVDTFSSLPPELSADKGDNAIIRVCKKLQQEQRDGEEKPVVLVSQDILLRVKGEALGVVCEEYKNLNLVQTNKAEELYHGIVEIEYRNVEAIYEMLKDENINHQEFALPELNYNVDGQEFHVNEYAVLTDPYTRQTIMLKCLDPEAYMFAKVREPSLGKLKPRNLEQKLAADMLFDDHIKLASIVGKAGCGKTLLALAAGLEQVLTQKKYKTLVVCRPVQPVGKDIGFLPGPQPLDAKILTPTGWTTMGEIKSGSFVIGRDGKPTKVLNIFPKGKKMVYKVTTTDGTSTECCEDHLWKTQTWEEKKRGKEGKVRTTKQIMESLAKNKNGELVPNHYLPRNEAIEFKKVKELPIDPYTLGILLGDGSFSDCIAFASQAKDAPEIVNRVTTGVKKLGCSITKPKNPESISYAIRGNVKNNKPAKAVKLTNILTNEIKIWSTIGDAIKNIDIDRGTLNYRCLKNCIVNNTKYEFLPCETKSTNLLKNEIINLGLSHKKAPEKFIPKQYIFEASIEDRLALLQGLMDTDGCVKENGEASFTTISKQLADDIIELVRSLGGRAKLHGRNRVGKTTKIGKRNVVTRYPTYEFVISLPSDKNPFFLSRKAQHYDQKYIHDAKIVSIVPVEEKEVQCILVENPEHLYITDEYIVTHNTMDEKMEPWIAPIKDNLSFLLSIDGKKGKDTETTLHYLFDRGTIEIEALTFIRGRSIANAYIIIDEAQNLSHHEIKTILTRVGEGTKIVLTGDIDQIDNLHVDSLTNGLTVAVEKFKDEDIAGHVTLVKGERSKLATIASEIL